ncbi:MAG: ATPase [Hirschia sp.]|nr:ATPase [Hirschia sp.]MBF19892.1 ATPase [Hirschia sp.]
MSGFGSIDQRPKRFYKHANAVETDKGWSVELDGRAIRTPEKSMLSMTSRGVAELIATEWNTQGELLDIANMHVTRLANVAFDRTPKVRLEMIEEVVRYAETDLVCHLADTPEELLQRQEASWGPLRDWAGETLGIVLLPVQGVLASRQPDASLDAVRTHAQALDDWRLTGLNYGLGLTGSAVIALAMEQNHIDADQAFAASRIDEVFQSERWGEDEEAEEAAARRLVELLALDAFFLALNS